MAAKKITIPAFLQQLGRKDLDAVVTGLLVLLGAFTAFKLLMILSPAKPGGAARGNTDSAKTAVVVNTNAGGGNTGVQVDTVVPGANKPAYAYIDSNFRLATVMKAPVDTTSYHKSAATSKTGKLNLFEWLIVPLLALIIGIRISLFYARQPRPNMKLDTDTDPEELTDVFRRFGSKIELLGNPRKIKRFSNKVRFQYHYLNNQHLLKEDNDLDELIETLLFVETHMGTMNLEKLPVADQQQPVAWFRRILNEERGINIDESLAKHLLQLNKNVIA